MKTWLLNPRVIERQRPTNVPNTPGVVLTVIDCPCGCLEPFVLPQVDGVTFPALGAVLTQLQWRLLLNNYTVPGRVHRVRALGAQCGWGGRIVLGRVFSRDNASEDDVPFGTRIQETLDWLRERGDVSINGR